MLTNTSYGSSRFKVSTARQLSLSVSNTRVSTDLQQKYGPMDSTKGILFYCDRMLSVCCTKSEGLVRHHAIRTASCINPATKNRWVQLFAINGRSIHLHICFQWWRRPNGLHSRSEGDGNKFIKRCTAGKASWPAISGQAPVLTL